MKTPRLISLDRFLAASLLVSTGCSREKPATTTAEAPVPAPTPTTAVPIDPAAVTPAPVSADPLAEMSIALERATLEQHEGLDNIQQRLDQDLVARVTAKKASADVSITADQKLDDASNDFAEKLRMLSVARPETWTTAKHDATQALQNVRLAYTEVMTSPTRH